MTKMNARKLWLGICLMLMLMIENPIECEESDKPKVSIYYETYNDVVRDFFIRQFRPLYQYIGYDNLDIRLYPFGTTTANQSATNETVTTAAAREVIYTCRAGDQQCLANQYHACVLNLTSSLDMPLSNETENFWGCFFKNRASKTDPSELAEYCTQEMSLIDIWGYLDVCAKSEDVSEIMDILSLKTEEIGQEIEEFGLVVQLNNQTIESSNLMEEVCKLLYTEIPEYCVIPAKVKVGVYYESMNTVVANYFQQQLVPYYHVLEDIIDLELIPFGNATVVNETAMEIECPQGDQQCFNNKFQALLILKYVTNSHQFPTLLGGMNQALNFITCLYKNNYGNQYSIVEQCDNQVLLGQDYIEFLAEIKETGEHLLNVLQDFYSKTKQQNIQTIPWITINDEHSPNAFNDLVQEICNNYTHSIKPAICTKISATILYEASHHPSRTFFLEQIKPTFQNLYNLIDFKFIPAGRTKIVAVNESHMEPECPGGPNQCKLMMIQACVLDDLYNDGSNYTDHNRQMVFDFVWCTFKNIRLIDDPMDLARYCSEDYLDNPSIYIDIENCLQVNVKPIFEEMIEETESLLGAGNDQSQFPIVIFNASVPDSQVILEDLSDFHDTICQHYDDYHKPDYCLIGEPNKVIVQVHYDSDNEFAKHFFLTQLDPWYRFIEEMADLRLYPVGNTEKLIGTDGVCNQTDNTVCIGNALNSYLIDLLENHDDEDPIDGRFRVLKFLSCFFSHPQWPANVEVAGEHCAEQELINQEWSQIWNSIKDGEYQQSLLNALAQTEKLKHGLNETENLNETYIAIPIPYVRFDETLLNQKQAIDDILQNVCSRYSGDKPIECTAASVDVYYSPLEYKTRRFFIDELIPTFRHIRERIQLNLVPFGIPASNDATVESECELDSERCEANRIQACALGLYWNSNVEPDDGLWDPKNQTLSFLYCFYKYIDDDDGLVGAMIKCENQYLPYEGEMIECVKNVNESNKYMNQMLQQTIAQPNPMESSPWVVINGDPNDLLVYDLQQSVCEKLRGEQPLACGIGRPSKVDVQIHYSAVCPDMYRFVVGDLAPNYREVEEIVNVELIPFGKSTIKLDADGMVTSMECPRETECRGTLIHACVVDEMTNNDHDIDGPLQLINFMDCYFKSDKYPQSIVEASEQCAETIFHTDIWSVIMECAHGPKGQQLLKNNSQVVAELLPHLTYIPWFVVNGRHSYTMEEHFVRTVCDAYEGTEKPTKCYEKSGDSRPVVQVFYELADQKSRYFFLKQFNESLSHLNELVRIQLIPMGRPAIQPKTVMMIGNDDMIPVDCSDDTDCVQTKQQACLMREHNQNQSKLIDFIACNFRENSDFRNNITETCVKQVFTGNDEIWPSIQECAAGENGQIYLNENQKMVHELKPTLTHVPWILINGEHDIRAEVNMADIVCSQYYGNDKPDGCQPELKSIKIYYETDNADVKEFFKTQISDQREYLDEWANFTMYPFGTTKIVGDSFKCTNGDQQCLANRIHACVMDLNYFNLPLLNPTRMRTMNFVDCALNRSKTTETENKECYEQNFQTGSWISIEHCYTTDEGKAIFEWMGRETKDANVKSVPWITIDGQRSMESVDNLFDVLCDSYTLIKAPRCYLIPSKSLNVGVYFSSDQKGMEFLIQQLLPFYSWAVPTGRSQRKSSHYLDGMDEIENQFKLQALLQVQLIPWGNTVFDNATQTFKCSSETECFLNRLMACADYYHRTEPKARLHLIEFALCMANNQDLSQQNQTIAAEKANSCANEVWLVDPFEQLDLCARSNQSDAVEIFLEMKTKTETVQPPLKQFPSVTIDSVPNEEAGNNLMKVVCQSYKGIESNVPKQCEEYRKPEPGPDSGCSTIHPSMIIFIISFLLLKFLS